MYDNLNAMAKLANSQQQVPNNTNAAIMEDANLMHKISYSSKKPSLQPQSNT